MKFIWADGHTRDVEIGKNFHGLRHKDARPKYVIILIDEIETACSARKLAMRPYLMQVKLAVQSQEIYLR